MSAPYRAHGPNNGSPRHRLRSGDHYCKGAAGRGLPARGKGHPKTLLSLRSLRLQSAVISTSATSAQSRTSIWATPSPVLSFSRSLGRPHPPTLVHRLPFPLGSRRVPFDGAEAGILSAAPNPPGARFLAALAIPTGPSSSTARVGFLHPSIRRQPPTQIQGPTRPFTRTYLSCRGPLFR